jgi:hypothetical protein
MNAEGVLIKGDSSEKKEPPKGFNGGDDGDVCDHPQCAVERMMIYAIEQITEGLQTFATADWELTPAMVDILCSHSAAILSVFEDEEIRIGEIHPVYPKEKKDGR